MKKITPDKTPGFDQRAFTFTEMLVVLAVIGMVVLTLSPVFAGTKYKTKTSMCAFNMRLWGIATSMYESDNQDFIPFFASSYSDPKVWYDYLSPYLNRATTSGSWLDSANGYYSNGSEVSTNEVRRCPAGNTLSNGFAGWDTWVGVNFSESGNSPLSGPFFYNERGFGYVYPPLKISRIRKPADALAFMDARVSWIYSPAAPNWTFDFDSDGDGLLDSSSFSGTGTPYNYAQPKVHENGANVTLLDGHVERVGFKSLWGTKSIHSGVVTNSFWFMED